MTHSTPGLALPDDERPPSPICRRKAPFQPLARDSLIRTGTGVDRSSR